VKLLLDAATQRFAEDTTRLLRALRALPAENVVSPGVLRAFARYRRDLLAASARISALETSDPARQRALAWLAVVLEGVEEFKRALTTRDPASAREHNSVAATRFAQATTARLALDRGLGCPYGCEPSAVKKVGTN
jgi:hypothetical protein